MSKLFALKKWVTPAEAAEYLSGVFEESVRVVDVLRFALSGELTISVLLVNHAAANMGVKKAIRDAGFSIVPSLRQAPPGVQCLFTADALPAFKEWIAADDARGSQLSDPAWPSKTVLLNGLQISGRECLVLSDEVRPIEGIWDLTMVGAERLDVQQLLMQETGGPGLSLQCLDGVLLRQGGTFARLVEFFGDNDDGEHYPAGGLPRDAMLVVRPEAIAAFVQQLSKQEQAEKPLDPREKNTYLRIIRALLSMAKVPPRSSVKAIEQQLETLGFAGPKEAAIREAVRSADALAPD